MTPISTSSAELEALWSHHHAQWREPLQIASQWENANQVNPQLLTSQAKGDWWDVLAQTKLTLLITREYEHLVMACTVKDNNQPHISYMALPHPSGMAFDSVNQRLYLASTRNPNQIYLLEPVCDHLVRADMDFSEQYLVEAPLLPVRSWFLPGCTYIHDLAHLNGQLYANAVGQNSVIHINEEGHFKRVWWPRCIETSEAPRFDLNYIQLNSIAPYQSIGQSFFSASCDTMSARRPGHKNFPVDGKGVIFSGETREPIGYGLTRPHSARYHQDKVWVDNSGYGEVGYISDQKFNSVTKLQGWTRGLFFTETVVFVATSRVIPRFSQYAPGLEVDKSICGIHAIELSSGKVLGSLLWPHGNQVFSIEGISNTTSLGFPTVVGRKKSPERDKALFYSYLTSSYREKKDD